MAELIVAECHPGNISDWPIPYTSRPFPHPPALSLVLFSADCLLQERRNSPEINLEKLLHWWRGRRREGKRTSVYVCVQRCYVLVLVLSISCKQPLL